MSKNLDYRRDRRSKKQFERDIALSTRIESKIIRRYTKYLYDVFGVVINVKENGCDNKGNFVEDDKVTAAADYLLNNQPMEVKFNKSNLDVFHLKISQLKSYKRQKAFILWINGWETDTPVFTVLKRSHLEHIQDHAPKVEFSGWGNKRCYRLNASDYKWHSF